MIALIWSHSKKKNKKKKKTNKQTWDIWLACMHNALMSLKFYLYSKLGSFNLVVILIYNGIHAEEWKLQKFLSSIVVYTWLIK